MRKDDRVISHLLYVYDLKQLGATKLQFTALLNVTENLSSSIKIEFSLEKCVVMYVKKSMIIVSEGINFRFYKTRISISM